MADTLAWCVSIYRHRGYYSTTVCLCQRLHCLLVAGTGIIAEGTLLRFTLNSISYYWHLYDTTFVSDCSVAPAVSWLCLVHNWKCGQVLKEKPGVNQSIDSLTLSLRYTHIQNIITLSFHTIGQFSWQFQWWHFYNRSIASYRMVHNVMTYSWQIYLSHNLADCMT